MVAVRVTVTVVCVAGGAWPRRWEMRSDVLGWSVIRTIAGGPFVVAVAGACSGARRLTTDSGTEASPIGCANSWLAPQVRTAVMAMPNSAAVPHPNAPRLTLVTVATRWLSARKARQALGRAIGSRSVATAPPNGRFSSVTSPPQP